MTADGDILIAGKPGVAYSEVKFKGLTSASLKENRLPEFTNVSSTWRTFTYESDAIGQTGWNYYKSSNRRGIIASVQGLQDEYIQRLVDKELLICDFTCSESDFPFYASLTGWRSQENWTNRVGNVLTHNAKLSRVVSKDEMGVTVIIQMSDKYFDTYDWSFDSKPVITFRLRDSKTPRWRE